MKTESVELMVVNAQNAVQIFTGGGLAGLLDGIEQQVRAIKLDPSTPGGREEIRSVAYKISRTKTALDAEGKKLTEEWRQATARVNAERKKSAERLEALQEEVRKPLTDFEGKEQRRVRAHEDSLGLITGMREMLAAHPDMSLALLLDHQRDVEALLPGYVWEEFKSRAEFARADLAKYLTDRIESRKKYEEEQVELARLRKAEAERLQRERDERLKAEAAENARLQAERKAKADADAEAKRVIEAAEKERLRVAKEAERVRLENERAQKAIEDARCREEQAKLAAEQRAKDAEEARTRAEARAAAELKAAQEKAARDAEVAVAHERARQERERKEEEVARAKRETNQRLRAKIRSDIVADLIEKSAEEIADALLAGHVRHVQVVF